MRRLVFTLIGFWMATVLAGCSTLGTPPEAPRVTVSNIEIVEATLLEQVYRVTLRIQNRSDQTLTLAGGSFDLALNDREFGSGVTDASVVIEPYGESKLDVRMISTVFSIVRLVQGLQDRGSEPLTYAISGRLSTGGIVPLSFSESGEIALPEPAGAVAR